MGSRSQKPRVQVIDADPIGSSGLPAEASVTEVIDVDWSTPQRQPHQVIEAETLPVHPSGGATTKREVEEWLPPANGPDDQRRAEPDPPGPTTAPSAAWPEARIAKERPDDPKDGETPLELDGRAHLPHLSAPGGDDGPTDLYASVSPYDAAAHVRLGVWSRVASIGSLVRTTVPLYDSASLRSIWSTLDLVVRLFLLANLILIVGLVGLLLADVHGVASDSHRRAAGQKQAISSTSWYLPSVHRPASQVILLLFNANRFPVDTNVETIAQGAAVRHLRIPASSTVETGITPQVGIGPVHVSAQAPIFVRRLVISPGTP